MKKSRFTDEQIISFIKQADSGLPVKDLCRKPDFTQSSEPSLEHGLCQRLPCPCQAYQVFNHR
jgi:hypothetical protein